MAKLKDFKFYGILLVGIIISLAAIYIFFITGPGGKIVINSLPFGPFFLQGIHLPGSTSSVSQNATKHISIVSNGSSNGLNVSIADSLQTREKGLMGVTRLDENSGMLFVFNDTTPQVQKFWMKDTKIPLDMIFFNTNKQVVYVEHDAKPCTADPCTIYTSQFPSEYVIETNAGWSLNHNIQPGDVLNLPQS